METEQGILDRAEQSGPRVWFMGPQGHHDNRPSVLGQGNLAKHCRSTGDSTCLGGLIPAAFDFILKGKPKHLPSFPAFFVLPSLLGKCYGEGPPFL